LVLVVQVVAHVVTIEITVLLPLLELLLTVWVVDKAVRIARDQSVVAAAVPEILLVSLLEHPDRVLLVEQHGLVIAPLAVVAVVVEVQRVQQHRLARVETVVLEKIFLHGLVNLLAPPTRVAVVVVEANMRLTVLVLAVLVVVGLVEVLLLQLLVPQTLVEAVVVVSVVVVVMAVDLVDQVSSTSVLELHK
jgi:hypothetical protein